MQSEFATFLRGQYTVHPRESIADWAAREIDFSRAPNYDTPIHAPFDPSFACYMIPVLGWLQDYTTREVWIRKCSRAAATEYVLAWLRWIIAVAPRPSYYLTADQMTTERFMESRIKRGMRTCPPANAYHKRARVTEHDIRYEHMDFRVSWPNAKGAFKQDGWAAIVADEFPTWKAFAADMLRKRAGTYAFHKIVGLGSPDPVGRHPDGDPVILEYDATDKCKWMMPDPATGNPFAWDFGGARSTHGLKWPEDARDAETGEWNLERVRTEAYYLTPDGTRIENKDRPAINKQGQWVAENPNAPKHIHGIWIVGPMVPFADGDFGVLAYRFLEAKRRGLDALKSYFFENWADVGDMPNSAQAGDGALRARELPYGRGGKFWESTDKDGETIIELPEHAPKGLILTVDVQKYHLWWVARWWAVVGERVESGLEEWGNLASFGDLCELVVSVQPNCIGIDVGGWGKTGRGKDVHPRYGEVVDFCASYGALALKGEDNMGQDIHTYPDQDPREGRRSSAARDSTYMRMTWNTDIMRSKLLAAIRGETTFGWHIPKMPGREYVRQVMSTHKVNGDWVLKKSYHDDHMFDCEAMQLALARYDSLIQ